MKQNSYELKQHILQVWKLSLPAILTQITTIVMQYIDSAMVGALGANASASIGLVSTTTWLFGGVTYAVSAGFSVQVAHHIGAGEEQEARNVERHGLLTAFCLSGILCLTGVLLSPHLPIWLGGSEDIIRNSSAYFLVFALMVPFSQLNSLSSSFLQCSGDMVTPSILNAAMCILDVIFNTLLIPHFGVMGAGMGTALACAVISLTMAWRCYFCNPALSLNRREKGAFERNILQKALKIGTPVAVQEIAMSGAQVASTMIIAGCSCNCSSFLRHYCRKLLLYAGIWYRVCCYHLSRQKHWCKERYTGPAVWDHLYRYGCCFYGADRTFHDVPVPLCVPYSYTRSQCPSACRTGSADRTSGRAFVWNLHCGCRCFARNRGYLCPKSDESWKHLDRADRTGYASGWPARTSGCVDCHGHRTMRPWTSDAVPP